MERHGKVAQPGSGRAAEVNPGPSAKAKAHVFYFCATVSLSAV